MTKELNAALGGREGTFRDLLQQTQTFLTQANGDHRGRRPGAARPGRRLGRAAQRRQDVIDAALRDIRPAAKVLREDTPDLTALLREVERFARTADHLVGRTRDPAARHDPRGRAGAGRVRPQQGAGTPSRSTRWSACRTSLDSVVPGDYLSTALDLHVDGATLPDLAEVVDGLLDELGPAPARGHADVRGWRAVSGVAAVFRNRLYL